MTFEKIVTSHTALGIWMKEMMPFVKGQSTIGGSVPFSLNSTFSSLDLALLIICYTSSENLDRGGGSQRQPMKEANKVTSCTSSSYPFSSSLSLSSSGKSTPANVKGASKKYHLSVPLLHLHFLATASSDESSIIFTLPMVAMSLGPNKAYKASKQTFYTLHRKL